MSPSRFGSHFLESQDTFIGQFIETSQESQIFMSSDFNFLSEYRLWS